MTENTTRVIKLANGDKLIVLPNLLITIFDKEQYRHPSAMH